MINRDILLCCSLVTNFLLLSLLIFRRQIRVEVRPYRSLKHYLGRKFYRNRSTQTEFPYGLPYYLDDHLVNYMQSYYNPPIYPYPDETLLSELFTREELFYHQPHPGTISQAAAAQVPPDLTSSINPEGNYRWVIPKVNINRPSSSKTKTLNKTRRPMENIPEEPEEY